MWTETSIQYVSQREVIQPVTAAPHPYYSNLKPRKHKTNLSKRSILKYGCNMACVLQSKRQWNATRCVLTQLEERSATKQCRMTMYPVATDLLSPTSTLFFPGFLLNMMTVAESLQHPSAKMAQLGSHSAGVCRSTTWRVFQDGYTSHTTPTMNETATILPRARTRALAARQG